ncbi:XRE family transcriptional regulator [Burkholderia anthina]|uniref:XRE family transcriptional regulator n=1 Tax=Burkholderia anthina TaxID=179879 RepID=UPI00158F3014|nr:LexA family transcriptional regulator [Burkholderia anthina]
MGDAEIGARIRARRKALGLTLTQLQERSGIGNGNLSKIENGKQSLTNKTMQALATALEVPLAELFSDVSTYDTKGYDFGHNSASAAQIHRMVSAFAKLSDIPKEESVAIGVVEVHPDPARGGVISRINERTCHLFHGGSISQLDSKPSQLGYVTVTDDTMAERIQPGDQVVIDLGDTTIPPAGGVFACVIDDENIVLRRIAPYAGGGISIMCDNRRYERLTMHLSARQASAVTIIGRAKHLQGNAGF